MLTDSKLRSAKNFEKSYKLTDALGLYLNSPPIITFDVLHHRQHAEPPLSTPYSIPTETEFVA